MLPDSPRIKALICLPFNHHRGTYEIVKEFGDRKGVAGFCVARVGVAWAYVADAGVALVIDCYSWQQVWLLGRASDAPVGLSVGGDRVLTGGIWLSALIV